MAMKCVCDRCGKPVAYSPEAHLFPPGDSPLKTITAKVQFFGPSRGAHSANHVDLCYDCMSIWFRGMAEKLAPEPLVSWNEATGTKDPDLAKDRQTASAE